MFVCHRYIYQYLIQDKHAKYASATVLTSDTGLLQILDWQDRISRTKSTWQGKGSANIANCKAGTFTREDYFEFNTADGEGDWEYNDLEGVKAEAGQSLRGKIEVLPGEEDQKTDIAMQIVTRSNDQDDLSSLKWKRYGAGLDLRYEFKNQTDICTEVNMKVYLRPLVYLIRFNFITTLFDIVVQSHLRWEVFVMGVISLHGNIEMNNERSLDPLLVTYFLYVRSNTGNIRGQ
jgi:hypothetical protein